MILNGKWLNAFYAICGKFEAGIYVGEFVEMADVIEAFVNRAAG